MVDNINQFTRAADLTMGEAEAFRAGWRAAIEAAAGVLASRADEQAGIALDDNRLSGTRRRAETAVSALDMARHAIRALEPPAPMREPTGLEIRGG